MSKSTRFILILFSFWVALSLLGQKTEKDLIAKTEDGRKVLLKSDGTWEFIEEYIKDNWQKVIAWKGSGLKNTESFVIRQKEWRICWETKATAYGVFFSIMSYKGDSQIPEVVANTTENSKDCSYMRGPGEYRLVINSVQAWEIRVEEKK